MKRSLIASFVTLALALPGCAEDPADVPVEPEAGEATGAGPLSELSAADRTAVLAQKLCPVTDEGLGSMGTPLKVTVQGRDVWVCCKGCVEEVEAHPEKYLAKLDAPVGEAAPAAAPAASALEGEGDAAPPEPAA